MKLVQNNEEMINKFQKVYASLGEANETIEYERA